MYTNFPVEFGKTKALIAPDLDKHAAATCCATRGGVALRSGRVPHLRRIRMDDLTSSRIPCDLIRWDGRDLRDALMKARASTKEVWVTGTIIPVDETEEELSPRIQRVVNRAVSARQSRIRARERQKYRESRD